MLCLPIFDGSYRVINSMSDGSDWKVMERGICHGVRLGAGGTDPAAAAESFCGAPLDAYWGY
jgi:hypothetical protein